jgi:ribosomal protein S27E
MMTPSERLKQRRQGAIDHLQTKFGNLKCQGCGQADWHADGVYALVGYDEAGPSTSAPEHAVVSVRCNGCGHTLLFSAAACGINMKDGLPL